MNELLPAVFLDRDGTIIEDVPYGTDPDKVHLFPDVRDGLTRLKAAGFHNVIITNQSGIGRGWVTPSQYSAIHARLLKLLGFDLIDGTYFCPDAPDTPSERRKPAPGMVLQAAEELGLDLRASWFIGDKTSDLECGENAGVRSILVRTGEGAKADPRAATYIAETFTDAVDFILTNSHGK
ncbi:MAG TPA: HAD family hydrolase [Chthoniobacteraceae bacterium]|jgi:D-glycero-D-manno-heptose 1,7-bisphosphate phosphatase